MNVFKQLKTKFQESGKLAQKLLSEYIIFVRESKQLVLTQKTVLLLCQQAINRVEQIKSLEPDSEEGLIATIEANQVKAELHFTPETITVHQDYIEGELRLLNPPKFSSESLIYRYLIAGWQTFLGGKIPNGVVPEGVRLEKDIIYYKLTRNQSDLVDALFSGVENDSNLSTSLVQGNLIISGAVVFNWNNIKIQKLIQALQVNFK